MWNSIEGPIEICGINHLFPTNATTFKEFHFQETVSILNKHPSTSSILKVHASVNVLEHNRVSTPIGMSNELYYLSGNSLVLMGEIKLKIEYANKDSHTIHSIPLKLPFSTYIVLDKVFEKDPDFMISSYIEDIYINQLGENQIFINMLIIFDSKLIN